LQLEFAGKTVLVVGGSSGIGNATAQAFRKNGAEVHVWGTRPCAADYADERGSELGGLIYRQVDITNIAAIEAPDAGLTRLGSSCSLKGSRFIGAESIECPISDRCSTST
jgi:3-oxoacyl-[acyl-carrier protein] reductase